MINVILLLLAAVAFVLAAAGAKVRRVDPIGWMAIGLLLVTLLPLIAAIHGAG